LLDFPMPMPRSFATKRGKTLFGFWPVRDRNQSSTRDPSVSSSVSDAAGGCSERAGRAIPRAPAECKDSLAAFISARSMPSRKVRFVG
jgi:hypothetical protein